jgi:hypothetical protein
VIKQFDYAFFKTGFDGLSDQTKNDICSALDESRFSADIRDWLDGKYIVGNECLTD